MNWLDIVIICLAGLGLAKGLYDGIIRQAASLVALIIGIYLCAGIAEWLRGFLTGLGWFPPQITVMISYVAGFILIAGFIVLIGVIIHRIVSVTPLSLFNHIAGGLLGLLLMVLFVSLVLNVIEMFDHKSVIFPHELKVESHLYLYIKNIIPSVFPGNIFVQKV
ncbi:MAG: CvpA family protein [Tannerella sp.]|jgi:membrane protein required for colicin V production|nr:CvpA family protein [Tannerella sp.]